jgi:hypothetical protein
MTAAVRPSDAPLRPGFAGVDDGSIGTEEEIEHAAIAGHSLPIGSHGVILLIFWAEPGSGRSDS